jgi:hypothetical protein
MANEKSVFTISEAEEKLITVLRDAAAVKGDGEIPVTIIAGDGKITGHDIGEAVKDAEAGMQADKQKARW